jgi:twinfilin
MLYSTVNKAAISAIEQTGIKITKKVEVESPSELTEDNLMLELHPELSERQTTPSTRFAKPARPGRGRARMTKS